MSATVRGEVAKRNNMIPLFAEELRRRGGDMYEAFLWTNYRFTMLSKPQVPIFHMTLTQKLLLHNPPKDDNMAASTVNEERPAIASGLARDLSNSGQSPSRLEPYPL